MPLKLNKSIKEQIADMAIRSKFKPEFDKRMGQLRENLHSVLFYENNNSDFDTLPDRAKKYISKASGVRLNQSIYMGSHIVGFDKRETGFLLNVAFETRREINMIKLNSQVYALSDYSGNASFPVKCENEVKSLLSFLKTASETRQILIDAMTHYKSAEKMFKELPWSEDFYPPQEKKTKCNIVPVSTIATANELMGVIQK